MKILVTIPEGPIKDTFIPREVVEKLMNMGEVLWNETNDQLDPGEIREKLKDVDVSITGWGCPKMDEYILGNTRKLKLVAHTGGTVAPVVSDYLFDRGIKIISGNWFYAESVAEGVIAYILASLRDIPYYNQEMHEGRWKTDNAINEGLLGRTIGLIGFGMTAKCLVKMLEPFRVKIKVYSKHIKDETLVEYGIERATLNEIFATCTIISVHASQRPDTYHMIDKRLLQMVQDGSILVNTARGSIIDEDALVEELQKGRFKAVLDVFEVEPLPQGSKLRWLQNVILIPHMAGPTVDRRKLVTLELMEDIERFFNGKDLKYEISKEYAAVMTT